MQKGLTSPSPHMAPRIQKNGLPYHDITPVLNKWNLRVIAQSTGNSNVLLFGCPFSGRSSVPFSLSRSLKKQYSPIGLENGIILHPLCEEITIIEGPSVTWNSLEQVKQLIVGEHSLFNKIPDVLIITFDVNDINKENNIQLIREVIHKAIQMNFIPMILVTMVDTIPASDLQEHFVKISQSLEVDQKLLFPWKNILAESHSEILQYFILRVFSKVLDKRRIVRRILEPSFEST